MTCDLFNSMTTPKSGRGGLSHIFIPMKQAGTVDRVSGFDNRLSKDGQLHRIAIVLSKRTHVYLLSCLGARMKHSFVDLELIVHAKNSMDL